MTLRVPIASADIVPRVDKKAILPNSPDNHRSQEEVVGGYSVVRPALLYVRSEAVIPAKAGIQVRNTGFRVKPGMTIKVKGLLTQYNSRFCQIQFYYYTWLMILL